MTVWHTAATAADYVQVSEPIIRAAVKGGDLEAHPIGTGREYRLDQDEIDNWLKSRSWVPATDRTAS